MRAYDIDLTIRIRCGASSEEEAKDISLDCFRNGKYSDADERYLKIEVKEVR